MTHKVFVQRKDRRALLSFLSRHPQSQSAFLFGVKKQLDIVPMTKDYVCFSIIRRRSSYLWFRCSTEFATCILRMCRSRWRGYRCGVHRLGEYDWPKIPMVSSGDRRHPGVRAARESPTRTSSAVPASFVESSSPPSAWPLAATQKVKR